MLSSLLICISLTSYSQEKNKLDTVWYKQLTDSMTLISFTKKDAVKFLGKQTGHDSSGHILVKNSLFGISKAVVGDLKHVNINLAINIDFDENRTISVSDVEAAIGKSQLMPSGPDDFDFSPSENRAIYYQPKDAFYQVRIFITVNKDHKLTNMHLDRERYK
jgi:hypothetical protein